MPNKKIQKQSFKKVFGPNVEQWTFLSGDRGNGFRTADTYILDKKGFTFSEGITPFSVKVTYEWELEMADTTQPPEDTRPTYFPYGPVPEPSNTPPLEKTLPLCPQCADHYTQSILKRDFFANCWYCLFCGWSFFGDRTKEREEE